MPRRPGERTDTESLPLPDAIVVGSDRVATVGRQRVVVPVAWWNRRLAELGLPGGPLQVATAGERATLTRELVWRHAEGAADDDAAALRLLWHALAWGAGGKLRQCHRRLEAVAADVSGAAYRLRRAARLARIEPSVAYESLHPNGVAAVSGLGPAFGTKFLYFAGGGEPRHPSLILDSRVAHALHGHGWSSLGTGGRWPAATYGRYCELLLRWARELSAVQGGPIAADELEYRLFVEGGRAGPPSAG